MFQWNNVNARCGWDESFQRGKYYVVGLLKLYADSSMTEYDENAIRFHLKMR